MSSQDNEVEYRVVAVLLVAVIVLVTGFAVGLGIHKSRGAVPSTQMAAPAATPAVAAVVSDDASVVVENGVVKFYFASGKADLAAGALVALGDAIAAAKAGKQLVLSGFHDATGDPAFNAELAKQRALAVRDALMGAGVAESSMELKKPEQTTGTGNDAEARRVEVMIAG
ncbi:MAG: OmpA family protein [Hydrogenophaga sp.]|uniref:OmpA family protein n=1 Tax=Hydrogenophaga sp. TaxID=1904254 RepID=UPI002AB9FBA3|nr:OmpA family protein [Hydrogenophaga sp.]MDZ4103794.1 OmpA family protein [Hydrogenophaga sp.]